MGIRDNRLLPVPPLAWEIVSSRLYHNVTQTYAVAAACLGAEVASQDGISRRLKQALAGVVVEEEH